MFSANTLIGTSPYDLDNGPAAVRVPTDRRYVPSRKALVRRVRTEYAEMPGLSLTLPQAIRLFGIEGGAAARILRGLAEEGFLCVSRTGQYVLRAGRA